jgi:hypothetical protein
MRAALTLLLLLGACAPAVERTDLGEHPQWEIDAWYDATGGVAPAACSTDSECAALEAELDIPETERAYGSPITQED